MKKKIYLSGPITGLTYDEATETWRTVAENYFSYWANEVETLSPMRGKEYQKGLGRLTGNMKEFESNPISTTNAILARDRNDTINSDLVFCNLLGAKIVSIGSVMEIAWADIARVPILLIMEKDGTNPHEHLFVKGLAGFHVETLVEGLEIARIFLNLKPHSPTNLMNQLGKFAGEGN
jgi:hypothetical protein